MQLQYSCRKSRIPAFSRAVASAVAANPLAIVIPCHRIIHKNGTLGAFGWGAQMKEKLLTLEQPVNTFEQGEKLREIEALPSSAASYHRIVRV
ncbi:MAG: methylated-DNA--[protein]-cysteine S-methyltransferase [Holosporales bacterium]|nr:methylated-DNA--[protein]-cysteine S-methyltransferase [Holosporales bacterium]